MRLNLETSEKLAEFFGKTIEKEEFAQLCRKFMYETIGLTLTSDQNKWMADPETIRDGHLWLHELCEILDPQLTREE